MNVCGVLVHAMAGRSAEVSRALTGIPGVELHGQADGERLIVTVEDSDKARAIDGLAAIHALPGVVAAALVYHEFDPDSENNSDVALEA